MAVVGASTKRGKLLVWCSLLLTRIGLAAIFFMAIGCYRRRCGGCVQLMMHLKKKGGCLSLMTEGVDDAEYGVKR